VNKRGTFIETCLKVGQTPDLFLNLMRFYSIIGDLLKKDLLTG